MSENQDEGNQGTAGTTPANASASPAPAQPLPENFQSIVAELVEKRVREIQADKDRRIPKLETQFAKIAKHLGIDDQERIEQAQRNLVLEEIVNERLAPQSTRGTADPGNTMEVSNFVAAAGLNANDPEVVAMSMKKFNTNDEMIAAVADLVRKQAKQPNPTSAQSAAPLGGNVQQADVATLTAEYQTKVKAARGNKEAIKGLKEAYKQKGVPVDKIVFGV